MKSPRGTPLEHILGDKVKVLVKAVAGNFESIADIAACVFPKYRDLKNPGDLYFMTETVSKRLHISGLTPALTPSDLSARLSTFGTVKSLDGFGLQDGVGQTRKFGYVTIEATPAALKRCFTSLSGTTWKGAKLRIGEAKPDFRERLAEERAKADQEPPRKRQRTHYSKYYATLSSDMSIVTRENADKRPGWKVMPSGRIVRSMRMRPGKPLPPLDEKKIIQTQGKEKKRVKLPDSRARIRSIDVTKWNGEYLRGSLLDGQITATPAVHPPRIHQERVGQLPPQEERDEEEDDDEADEEEVDQPQKETPQADVISLVIETPKPATSKPQTLVSEPDFAQERAQNISLLDALLGGGGEWDGRESDSDIDVDESRIIEGDGGKQDDYEVVPIDTPAVHTKPQTETVEMEVDEPPPPPKVSLKDLFAPREEEGGFSLLGHLDLELDGELDLTSFGIPSDANANAALTQNPQQQPIPALISTLNSQSASNHQRMNFSPKMSLFFPQEETLTPKGNALASSPFYQYQTEEQIRQRWEENKVELTRGWKKRWREAVKVKRRRGGGKDGEVEM